MTLAPVDDRRGAFTALVQQVHEPLQRYLRRRTDVSTAEDVLGDVLLVMWRRLDEIPADAPLAWSYGVAHRCLANQQRGQRRHLALLRRVAAERPVTVADDADPALTEALAALSENDRDLLRLWAWEDLGPQEIAVVLGVTANAVSIRLHRAKKHLRDELERRKNAAPAGHLGDRQQMQEPR
ncbi:MAG: sigma-70 family RNA polymerase sigma factor [Frankiaceae bacterium]|nr:sigma-70 family RNA polymerase sigma factor [Frankiaceae bacterium]